MPLSKSAKLHQLRALAVSALAHYDLREPQIAFHAFETNLLYRVTTSSGERFMLRLASPGWRTLTDLQAEAVWLEALARETSISAPRIIPVSSGEYVLPLSLPGFPETWNTSLMTWVPGRLLGHYLTPRNLAKMGELFAALHSQAGSWTPPAGFTTRRFEHWLSRGEENCLTGGAQDGNSALPSRSRGLLENMHQVVEQAYAAVNRSDLRIIHCDLWHDNIKLDQGVLHPFDFEDTVWGFRAHDIAMAMLDLLEVVGEARYAQLLSAFRSSYTANLDWPEAPIQIFQIGRLLWKINWVARHQSQWLEKMVERHVPVFEHYLQTGSVILPPG
jgi:Ser/Thr protein kinase RdoA (MazF antagonist)